VHAPFADVGGISGESRFVNDALLHDGAVDGESVGWRGGSGSGRGGFWGCGYDERFEDRVLYVFLFVLDFFAFLCLSFFSHALQNGGTYNNGGIPYRDLRMVISQRFLESSVARLYELCQLLMQEGATCRYMAQQAIDMRIIYAHHLI
jgi:hypothetical protein